MTVKELIEQLSKLPHDMIIKSANYDYNDRELHDLDEKTIVIIQDRVAPSYPHKAPDKADTVGEIAVIDPLDLMRVYDTLDEFLSRQ